MHFSGLGKTEKRPESGLWLSTLTSTFPEEEPCAINFFRDSGLNYKHISGEITGSANATRHFFVRLTANSLVTDALQNIFLSPSIHLFSAPLPRKTSERCPLWAPPAYNGVIWPLHLVLKTEKEIIKTYGTRTRHSKSKHLFLSPS